MDRYFLLAWSKLWRAIGTIGVEICPGCAADLGQKTVKLSCDADGRYWHAICFSSRRCVTHNRAKVPGGQLMEIWTGLFDEEGVRIYRRTRTGNEPLCPECPLPYDIWQCEWRGLWADLGKEVIARHRRNAPAVPTATPYAPSMDKWKLPANFEYDDKITGLAAWIPLALGKEEPGSAMVRKRDSVKKWREEWGRCWQLIGQARYTDVRWWRWWRRFTVALSRAGKAEQRKRDRLMNPEANLEEMDPAERRFAQMEIY
jgi:hypothetical protein